MSAATRTHKVTGWTRTPLGDGSGCWRIVPTDDSGDRIVRFLSAHSGANDPNDDPINQSIDRVVLISGEPLPDWAAAWLYAANQRSCASGREALRMALADAEWNQDRRDGGSGICCPGFDREPWAVLSHLRFT